MPYVDLAFRLTGDAVPVDHGYALYGAISRFLPKLHADKEIGLHPIRGRYMGDGSLHLTSYSRLTIRLPADRISSVLTLTGKALEVDGHRLRVGVCETRAIRPTVTLYSRLVTIKGFMETDLFAAAGLCVRASSRPSLTPDIQRKGSEASGSAAFNTARQRGKRSPTSGAGPDRPR